MPKRTVHFYPLRRSKRLKRKTELQKVVVAVNQGWNKWDESLRQWKPLRDKLTYAQGLLWRSRRICVQVPLREMALRLAHEAHQGSVRSKQRLRASLIWPGMDSEIKSSAITAKLEYDCNH